MINSIDDFHIVQNVIDCTKGIKKNVNWVKVQKILLMGTGYSGRSTSVEKCIELGVNPDGYEWKRNGMHR